MRELYRRISRLVRYIALESDYEPFELFGTLIMILSAAVVLNPYTDVFSNGKAYDYIAAILSEAGLGALLLFIGINSLFALFSESMVYRLWTSFVQATIWATLFSLFIVANPGTWFPWFLGVFALFSFIVVGRIARDIKDKKIPWTHR